MFEKAAEKFHAGAQFKLGEICTRGRDHTEALKWFNKAEQQGHAPASDRLGVWYGEGKYVGQDLNRAVALQQAAAKQGYPHAMCNLGIAHELGWGALRDDREQSLHLFEKAAKGGSKLGLYLFGKGLVWNGKDPEKGIVLLRRAAEKGVDDAQYFLGTCWLLREKELIGEKEAEFWLGEAVKQGHEEACQHREPRPWA